MQAKQNLCVQQERAANSLGISVQMQQISSSDEVASGSGCIIGAGCGIILISCRGTSAWLLHTCFEHFKSASGKVDGLRFLCATETQSLIFHMMRH